MSLSDLFSKIPGIPEPPGFDTIKLPKIEVKEEVKVEVKEIKEVKPARLTARQAILAEYGGLESNVPVNSPYWKSK